MKWLVVAMILAGVASVEIALADEDFGEDDFGAPEPQKIYVPGAQRAGTLPKPLPTSSSREGGDELPFEILGTELDGDGDGLSDVDEVRLATDAKNPDTDGDGYIDGLEVVRGYNPLKKGPEDKVVLTQLDIASPSSVYRVTGVRLETRGGQEALVVTGVGPANSLVTLLVMSDEIKTWIARADGTGRFIYVSADTLALGPHRVYAAGTAAGGAVLAVSRPLNFARAEGTLEVVEVATVAPLLDEQKKPQPTVVNDESRRWLAVAAGTSIISAALAIGGGFWWWRRARGKIA